MLSLKTIPFTKRKKSVKSQIVSLSNSLTSFNVKICYLERKCIDYLIGNIIMLTELVEKK